MRFFPSIIKNGRQLEIPGKATPTQSCGCNMKQLMKNKINLSWI